MNDPIVDEVRKIRDEHAQRFNYDLTAICADIRRHQDHCGHRVVRLHRDANKSMHLTGASRPPETGRPRCPVR